MSWDEILQHDWNSVEASFPDLFLCQGRLVNLLDVKLLKSEDGNCYLSMLVFFSSAYVLPLQYSYLSKIG